IDRPRDGGAAAGDQQRDEPAQRLRQGDDGAVVEEVEQKRSNRPRPVRSAENDEDERGPAHRGEPRRLAERREVEHQDTKNTKDSLWRASRARIPLGVLVSW